MPSLEIVSKDEQRISVKMTGVPLQYANALRRICLNGVPVFAVDTVDVIENTSVLPDEGLAHRLGLVPLRTDLERFTETSKCTCGGEGCSNCRVMLVLDSGESEETRTVLSDEISSEDDSVRPTSGGIAIVELAPGQRIKVECYARLGRGTEHAKWNASNVSILTETGNKGEHLLTVESTGALAPEKVVMAGAEEVSGRLGQFKEITSGI
ncbi:MAG: DNA-directed RNA polymerase subunit D [Nitrosopumilus sp.]|nr:DNA-directed RNA polymerase subunit D [Nitrosopumilus sp.]CAI9831983.1 RNA polymerase insert [Nitrosopumilaceae archaeon]MDA7941758.1 DNA-directed RNA polymerase subunit D [Nitrosopumilus sp.]MDA7943707.1 DNA-directed RNA polymerase subunit D [Nitrosopumilus sp.]MDA7945686.1 DNA-directed RNA polymerase subunit D [Nitrosopumilus sp.]